MMPPGIWSFRLLKHYVPMLFALDGECLCDLLGDMSLGEFANRCLANLNRGMATNYFSELGEAVERAYVSAIEAAASTGSPLIFGRFLLICDKSFRSACCLIASSQPEDSVGITRRAVECARTALAIKVSEDNLNHWLAADERMERWARRQSNEKPKGSIRIDWEGLKTEPFVADLDKFLGILSDAYVHFTPEFYSTLAWSLERIDDERGNMVLNYFHLDWREIERHHLMLASVHGVILKVFDRCFDGKLRANGRHAAAINDLWHVGKAFNDEYRRKYGEAGGVVV